MAYKILVVEKA